MSHRPVSCSRRIALAAAIAPSASAATEVERFGLVEPEQKSALGAGSHQGVELGAGGQVVRQGIGREPHAAEDDRDREARLALVWLAAFPAAAAAAAPGQRSRSSPTARQA